MLLFPPERKRALLFPRLFAPDDPTIDCGVARNEEKTRRISAGVMHGSESCQPPTHPCALFHGSSFVRPPLPAAARRTGRADDSGRGSRRFIQSPAEPRLIFCHLTASFRLSGQGLQGRRARLGSARSACSPVTGRTEAELCHCYPAAGYTPDAEDRLALSRLSFGRTFA